MVKSLDVLAAPGSDYFFYSRCIRGPNEGERAEPRCTHPKPMIHDNAREGVCTPLQTCNCHCWNGPSEYSIPLPFEQGAAVRLSRPERGPAMVDNSTPPYLQNVVDEANLFWLALLSWASAPRLLFVRRPCTLFASDP